MQVKCSLFNHWHLCFTRLPCYGRRVRRNAVRLLKMRFTTLYKITYLLFLSFLYGCGTCSIDISFSNDTSVRQEIEITNKNGSVSNFILDSKSDSSYHSDYFMGTKIQFKNQLPNYIFETVDTDHWFGQNHKFYVSIQSDTIKFNDFEFFYWRSEKIK